VVEHAEQHKIVKAEDLLLAPNWDEQFIPDRTILSLAFEKTSDKK